MRKDGRPLYSLSLDDDSIDAEPCVISAAAVLRAAGLGCIPNAMPAAFAGTAGAGIDAAALAASACAAMRTADERARTRAGTNQGANIAALAAAMSELASATAEAGANQAAQLRELAATTANTGLQPAAATACRPPGEGKPAERVPWLLRLAAAAAAGMVPATLRFTDGDRVTTVRQRIMVAQLGSEPPLKGLPKL
eukprot:g3235.t1